MRTRDGIHLAGKLRLYLFRGDLPFADDAEQLCRFIDSGEAQRRATSSIVVGNLVVNQGRQQIAKRITDQAGVTSPTHIALGTTVFTPAVTDTTLTGEFFRKACSTVAPFQDYFGRWVMNALTTEANGTLRCAALFDAATAGNMWAEVATNVVKTSGQSLLSEWTIEVKT